MPLQRPMLYCNRIFEKSAAILYIHWVTTVLYDVRHTAGGLDWPWPLWPSIGGPIERAKKYNRRATRQVALLGATPLLLCYDGSDTFNATYYNKHKHIFVFIVSISILKTFVHIFPICTYIQNVPQICSTWLWRCLIRPFSVTWRPKINIPTAASIGSLNIASKLQPGAASQS